MKKGLTLSEFTIPAKNVCFNCRQKDAEMAFLRLNMTGKTFLGLVTAMNQKNKKLLWVNVSEEKINGFLPVFLEDANLDDFCCESITAIDGFSICKILHNNDYHTYHYICPNKSGKITIRNLRIVAYQSLIEQTCMAMDIVTDSVYLCRMYKVCDTSFFAMCWIVFGTGFDQNGEECDAKVVVPVFAHDAEKFEKVSDSELFSKTLKEGDCFINGSDTYCLCRNAEGKQYLSKEAFGQQNLQATSEPQKDETVTASARKCKILKMH